MHRREKVRKPKYALLGLVGFLRKKNGLDVGQNASLGDGDSSQKFVELLVVPDGELQVTGDDPGLLVVPGGVSGELEDFRGEVLHDGGQVDGGSGSDAISVVALAEKTMDATHGELKSGPARTGLCLLLSFASFAASRHGEEIGLLVTKVWIEDDEIALRASKRLINNFEFQLFLYLRVGSDLEKELRSGSDISANQNPPFRLAPFSRRRGKRKTLDQTSQVGELSLQGCQMF